MVNNVPLPTLKRFSIYISIIEENREEEWISTSLLSYKSKSPAITIRKDIGFLGIKGFPKKGYRREELIKALISALGGESSKDLIIIGSYGLGKFYMDNPSFVPVGYKIRAAFDFIKEENLKGTLPIYPFERLKDLIPRLGVSIALLSFKTIPGDLAKLKAWGLKGVVNLGTVDLDLDIPQVRFDPLGGLSELNGIISSRKEI